MTTINTRLYIPFIKQGLNILIPDLGFPADKKQLISEIIHCRDDVHYEVIKSISDILLTEGVNGFDVWRNMYAYLTGIAWFAVKEGGADWFVFDGDKQLTQARFITTLVFLADISSMDEFQFISHQLLAKETIELFDTSGYDYPTVSNDVMRLFVKG